MSTGLGVLLKTGEFELLFPRETGLAQNGIQILYQGLHPPALGYHSPCPDGL